MAEINPIELIAECIEKCKATTDRDRIAHYLSEALGFLQIDDTEAGAFELVGGAIGDAVEEDPEGCSALAAVWGELQQQRAP